MSIGRNCTTTASLRLLGATLSSNRICRSHEPSGAGVPGAGAARARNSIQVVRNNIGLKVYFVEKIEADKFFLISDLHFVVRDYHFLGRVFCNTK